ncbi:MAG TPA: dodecin family protein, partial [Nitrososphaeraceae archaeon]|nr:dodecin family protein [Nitrososphaeraceae archaeon]
MCRYKALAEVFCFSESDKSWEDAAQTAVKEAVKTIRNVHAIEVLDMTAKVDPNSGNIKEYRIGIKLAFGVER